MPKIMVDTDGKRLLVKPAEFLGTDLFQDYLSATKQVSGVRYSQAAGCQTAPLDMEVCRDLRRVFGASLVLSPAIVAWANEAREHERAVDDAHARDMREPCDLPYVRALAPAVWEAMQNRSFQTHVPRFAKLAGNILIADQPGLGKTLETFATLIESGTDGAVLVIAPQTSLYPTWAHEVDKWLGDTGATAWVVGDARLSKAKREAMLHQALKHAEDHPGLLTFIMINAEMVRMKEVHDCNPTTADQVNAANGADPCDGTLEWCPYAESHESHRETAFPMLFSINWAAVIGDEVHRYLLNANPRSKKVSQVGLGFQRLKNGRRIAISGTPMKGKPRLLWPIFRWLNPKKYTGQWGWSKRYFQTEEDVWSGNDKITDNLRPEMEESFNREIGSMMIRRTKAELRALNPAWAPPEKRYAEVWLPMSAKQEKAYRSMQGVAQARLSSGTLSANGVLAEMTRLRQFASCYGDMEQRRGEPHFQPSLPSNKYEWLIDTMLPTLGITGNPKTDDGESKIVVASQFTAMIDIWAAGLREKGIDCFVLTGATPQQDRAAMVTRWQQSGGPRVFLLNTQAGGVSLTLDAADDLVIMDETWVPDDQEQVEDRVHRTSRTDHQVTIWYVRSEGTIERDLAGSNIVKDDRQKRVLDGRRGIEVARRTLGAAVAV